MGVKYYFSRRMVQFPSWEGQLSSLGCWTAPHIVTSALGHTQCMCARGPMGGCSHWHPCDTNVEVFSYSLRPSALGFWLL